MGDIHSAHGASGRRSTREGGIRLFALPAAILSVITLTVMLAISWGLLFPTSASASAASGRVGTLTISATVADGGTRVLAGDTYAVAQVADATIGDDGTINGFSTRDAFSAVGRDWGSLSSSQYNEAAKELAEYASSHGLYDVTDHAVTGADGRAVVRDLAPGLYLVSRTAVADANSAYVCDAFLVAIPETEPGTSGGASSAANYAVVASPKFEQVPAPGPEPSENPSGKPTPEPSKNPSPTPAVPSQQSNIAKTGAAIMRYVQVAVIFGGIALVFLFIRSRYASTRHDDLH